MASRAVKTNLNRLEFLLKSCYLCPTRFDVPETCVILSRSVVESSKVPSTQNLKTLAVGKPSNYEDGRGTSGINFPEHNKDLVSYQKSLSAKTRAMQIPLVTLEKTAATSGSCEPESGSSWCHFLAAAVKSQRTFVPCNTLLYCCVKCFQYAGSSFTQVYIFS